MDKLIVRGARENNLKNVTVEIPKNALVVVTGPSGSGKSSFAFDILQKEGQREYLESLGMVTDYVSRPKFDRIEGLSPTISVDQHLANRSPRSTVGTETEIYTYLRVLFARLGRRVCPDCGTEVPPVLEIDASAATDTEVESSGKTIRCPGCGRAMAVLGMAHFSFNKPDGACPTCTGLGAIQEVDQDKLVDRSKSISGGAIVDWDEWYIERYTTSGKAAARHYGYEFDPDLPLKKWKRPALDWLLYGVDHPRFKAQFPKTAAPTTSASGHFEGLVTNYMRRYAEKIDNAKYRAKMEARIVKRPCPDCEGARLKKESRETTVAGRSILEVTRMPIGEIAAWLQGLDPVLGPAEQRIYEPVRADLVERTRRVVEAGADYLTLDRESPTLSAGEAQRLRLAALLGSGLTGVLYILDEPTIGLHQRDTARLAAMLKRIRDLGNTVVVIEHDLELVRAADHIVDFGPGAGREGGLVCASGNVEDIRAAIDSPTGRFLSGVERIPMPARRRRGNGNKLIIRGARANNLKAVTAEIPLGMLVAVTGVSGSGKSTLLFDILDAAARRRYFNAGDEIGEHDAIEGWEHIDRVITTDQKPIGRVPRSNAATYTDAFTPIRKAFAAAPRAVELGLTESAFSFNVAGGRCEKCEGAGVVTIPMHFLPDVEVPCPVCSGRRFKPEVLSVRYGGHDIAEILEMTVAEALPVFAEVPAVRSRLALLAETGLSYLCLGQPATTLSGGEAQRVKLAKELSRRNGERTLYLLDEPTTGLHPSDIRNLLKLLHGLTDAGHTVVVVEHQIDVIAASDWVIDLGPEGGDRGGELVAAGTPEEVARNPESATGLCLRRVLGVG